MKQSVIYKHLAFILSLVTAALWIGHGFVSARPRPSQPEISVGSAGSPQQLSSQGQASLQAILQAGKLADLRWPDFSDYVAAAAEVL